MCAEDDNDCDETVHHGWREVDVAYKGPLIAYSVMNILCLIRADYFVTIAVHQLWAFAVIMVGILAYFALAMFFDSSEY